ncbi:MAG TPA: FAD-dependent thymidylate synthase [bacterium]|nr:FAD-dependent thymidylate synthase [bacterium]
MAEVQFLAITPNAEELIERAARTCHRSRLGIDAGSRTNFIQKVIELGHLSVLEHASATFRILGVSRAFSHQLVRHRLASFSQRSQRYVSDRDFAYVVPPSLERRGEALKVFEAAMAAARDAYGRLLELKVPREDARFVLPNAAETELVMTANMREFRHIFELRCHRTAQWEIRSIAVQMLKVLKAELPAVFADFEMAEDGSHAWTMPPVSP